MRATEKASWELANKEKRFGFEKIVGNETELFTMTFACCSTHNLFCVPNRKRRKLTSEKGGLHSKEAKRREDRKKQKVFSYGKQRRKRRLIKSKNNVL
jgi:adenine/guanine phosphoribosyltransferase-like PRPP-binding protein